MLQTVKKIRHIVGLSCEAFEEELMALFAAIEVGHSEQALASCSSFGKKGNKNLRSVSSIKYDVNNGSASIGRVKGRTDSGEWGIVWLKVVRFPILVNGSLSGFFSSSRRLRRVIICRIFSLLL